MLGWPVPNPLRVTCVTVEFSRIDKPIMDTNDLYLDGRADGTRVSNMVTFRGVSYNICA